MNKNLNSKFGEGFSASRRSFARTYDFTFKWIDNYIDAEATIRFDDNVEYRNMEIRWVGRDPLFDKKEEIEFFEWLREKLLTAKWSC